MTSTQYTTSSIAKFLVPLQGGFDGGSPTKTILVGSSIADGNVMGFNANNSTYDTNEYIRAIKCV